MSQAAAQVGGSITVTLAGGAVTFTVDGVPAKTLGVIALAIGLCICCAISSGSGKVSSATRAPRKRPKKRAIDSPAAGAQGFFTVIDDEHNSFEQGRKGMSIRCDFQVNGLRDVPCQALVYFAGSDGTLLKNFNGENCSNDGTVVVSKDFTPGHDEAVYNDFRLFMPYDELHMAPGNHTLKFYTTLFDQRTGQTIVSSDWTEFSFDS